MKKISSIVICCAVLSSCSLFGSDKTPLEGERISVMQGGQNSSKPDAGAEDIKIRLPRPAVNQSWGQRGGNSQHVMQHLMASRDLSLAWDEDFGDGAGKRDFLLAEPVIANNVIFTIDKDAVITAFNQEDGEDIWDRRLKPMNKDDDEIAMKGAGLAVYGNRLYATTGFGSVFAMNAENGDILWRYNTSTPIRVAPTVGSDKVFAQTIDNTIVALDATSGTEIWEQQTNVDPTTLVGGAAAAYDEELDVVIVAFNNGELRAYKASTGSPLWSDYLVAKRRSNSLANINAIKANPVIDEGIVYAASTNSIFVAIDLRTGARIWEREIGMNNQPWIAGDYLFGLTENADLFAMEKRTGKIIWNTNIPLAAEIEDKSGVFVSGPVLVNNRLIVASSNGYAFAVSPYVGTILGFVELEDGVVLSPVVANEEVIFTSSDAEIMVYK